MEILAINVAQLRGHTGMTQLQLANRIGVGTTTVNNIETGYLTAPSDALLELIAKAFDTTVDGLVGNKPLDVGERARMIYIVDSIEPGHPFVEIEKIVGSVFIDRDKLRGYDHFGLKVKDNSMVNRRILQDDVIIIRVNAPVKNNDVVVAITENEETAVIRTYFKMNNTILLKAENDSDLYSDIKVEDGDDSFKLIGKVVKCEFVP